MSHVRGRVVRARGRGATLAAMTEFTEITSGLRFPEGPIAMPDGSVILVEMFGPRITRVHPDGTKETVAEIVGGPNGAAIGPDGALYLCNNGGCFTPVDLGDLMLPGPFDPERYIGGRIQRVDLATGEVTDLYTECDGRPLRAPNDLVFDAHGGFWFTDHGIRDHHARTSDLTGIYYAKADGSRISEQVFPVEAPNGIGLSPDGTTVYWAETTTGRVLRRTISEPGVAMRPGAARHDVRSSPASRVTSCSTRWPSTATATCASRTLINGGITDHLAGRRQRRPRAHRRPADHQHLLRRQRRQRRVPRRLHHVLGHGSVCCTCAGRTTGLRLNYL